MLEAAKRMTMNGHDVSLRENEVSIFDQVIYNKYRVYHIEMDKTKLL